MHTDIRFTAQQGYVSRKAQAVERSTGIPTNIRNKTQAIKSNTHVHFHTQTSARISCLSSKSLTAISNSVTSL